MGVEVLTESLLPSRILAATLPPNQAGLRGRLVEVLAVGGWRVLHALSWLLVSLAEVRAKWWGLWGIGLLWGAGVDPSSVELGGFLNGGHICWSNTCESPSILASHGQPLPGCRLALYWSVVTGQAAVMEGRLRSFLLLVTFLRFLSPCFVFGGRLRGLACRLSLARGAACSLLHWFVPAGKKTNKVRWGSEALLTQS